MCDLNRVSGFLIAAKTAYLATLIALGIAVLNSASLFAAAANVLLMIGVIAGAVLATSMFAAALNEMDKCKTEPCWRELEPLRENLVILFTTMGVYSATLAGIAAVAAFPFVGAAAVGSVLAWAIALTVLVTSFVEFRFGQLAAGYNNCRASNGLGGLGWIVVGLAYLVAVVAAAVSIGGGVSGRLPWRVEL